MKLWTLFTCLMLLCAAPASAQSKREQRRLKAVAKLAKKLGVPAEALAKVGGERFASSKAAERRALLGAVAAQRPVELMPLLVRMALEDRDLDCRASATALLSVVGLDADRDAYLQHVHPAMSKLFRDPFDRIHTLAASETDRLARWFQHDKEIAELLEKTFKGKHKPMAIAAWKTLLALENQELRDGVVMNAMREVQSPKSRFAVRERRASFRQNGPRGGPWTAKQLAPLVIEDGTVAVAVCQSLADMQGTVALPFLRRIDRTASHVLRIPALMTRGALQDETLLDMLEATLASDHINIQCALVAALAKLELPTVDKVLVRLAKVSGEERLQQAVALARLERGDAGGLALLEGLVQGDAPSVPVARAILDVRDRAADPLVIEIARNAAGPLAGERRRAIARLGDTAIEGAVVLELLTELQQGDPNPTRLNAAASLLQLGAKDAQQTLAAALKDYDVVNRVDVITPCGKGRRFNGSPLIGVMVRFARAKTLAAAPVLAAWLDPPAPEPAEEEPKKAPEPQGQAQEEDATRTRKKPATPPPATTAAKPASWLEHPFVRREAVLSLGSLAEALAERVKAPEAKDDPLKLEADLEQALRALARSLLDGRGVVRRAAIQALAPFAATVLPVGASLAEEEEARVEVDRWLARRRKG